MDDIGSDFVEIFVVDLGLVVFLDAFVYASEKLFNLGLLVDVHLCI